MTTPGIPAQLKKLGEKVARLRSSFDDELDAVHEELQALETRLAELERWRVVLDQNVQKQDP